MFLVVAGLLVAAVPVSAIASEDWLRTTVRQAEAQFDQELTQAITNGLDPVRGDQLLWRYSQITAAKPSAWWLAPAVEHSQLDRIAALEADLRTAYARDLSDRRDAFARALRDWSRLLAEAGSAGVAADDLTSVNIFVRSSREAVTPNDFVALSQVLADQATTLNDRLAAYRSAQGAALLALENARNVLTSAGQYPQLSLGAFAAQLDAAASDLGSVHRADGFQPVVDRIQQTAIAVQNLINARAAADAQLADTRTTLATAQSIGANTGNSTAVIGTLATQLASAGDLATFQAITGQLYQQKQALANAIWIRQSNITPGAGKVIVISLARQTLTAYQDGQVVLTTYVTTGRPALPTPPGVYQVMAKYSPFEFISPWPYGSPYWYPSSWVSYAMLFRGGGYFIHDAPWRSWYGPGSNIYDGSHGCVNVPLSPMTFLFRWTAIGTTVIVQLG